MNSSTLMHRLRRGMSAAAVGLSLSAPDLAAAEVEDAGVEIEAGDAQEERSSHGRGSRRGVKASFGAAIEEPSLAPLERALAIDFPLAPNSTAEELTQMLLELKPLERTYVFSSWAGSADPERRLALALILWHPFTEVGALLALEHLREDRVAAVRVSAEEALQRRFPASALG